MRRLTHSVTTRGQAAPVYAYSSPAGTGSPMDYFPISQIPINFQAHQIHHQSYGMSTLLFVNVKDIQVMMKSYK
ncbi:hypothetical protein M378DRAFT_579106 [Amanita muscaria Koide BX008]|uniref:Uncharacterized protein n=1 Tax=Amanita muscaria (strain Koide BX008) TaxID=946122 RepID=A0A0C2WSC5_AMAMK|nr:hypothetical protein M378DRAFT_579106 [Amanita muscaria Koide BX008]